VTVAPDFAAPIVGWRTWLVIERAEGFRLGSVVQPTLWEPRRQLVAECLARTPLSWLFRRRRRTFDHAPDASCSCGIYASKDAELAGEYVLTAEIQRPFVAARVIGLVSLWGRVLACPRGWRAEFAYPARIYVPRGKNHASGSLRTEELALSLADYGVPVEIVSHRDDADLVDVVASHSPA
jgi:hypothetical protein